MVQRKVFSLVLTFVFFSMAGCGAAGGPGPRTWIDAPLDGMTLEAGPVIVRSHAASEAGTVQAALIVNGAQVRVDNAVDASSPLVEFTQSWSPSTPGDYVLQVITTDPQGNQGHSNSVLVHIGGEIPPQVVTTVTVAVTGTPVTPTATTSTESRFTFDKNANCREGDSTNYEVVTSFLLGQQVVIQGRNADSSWFWILIPGGGNCFVASSTGTAQGPIETLPVRTAPPLPATLTPIPEQQPPESPGNLQLTGEICNANEFKVTFGWETASGADGYNIYRDGQLIDSLGAGGTSYTDAPPNYNAHTYGVEAYNDAGTSSRPTVQEDGCVY